MNQRTKRALRVRSRLDSLPLREEAVREAFEHFKMFGELPEQERLAQAVIESAIVGEVQTVNEGNDLMRAFRQLREERDAPGGKPKERTLREYLLDHAGFAPEPLRAHARLACGVLAAKGHDLTDPRTLADAPLPEHNGIGMALLGYPDKLATEPYVEQAQRLFARFAVLRDRTPACADEWLEDFEGAAIAFGETGEFPDDELMREAVLAAVEFECLLRHKRGVDVAEWMAALDRAAQCEGEEREVAVAEVTRIVMARR